MNGSLGVVTKPHPKGARARFDDGAEDVITTADLEKLTHGWAISVHKAQGSAFKRVHPCRPVKAAGPNLALHRDNSRHRDRRSRRRHRSHQRDNRGSSGELTANHSTPVRRELATAHGVSSSAIRSLRMNAQSMSSAMDGPRAFPIFVSAYSTFGGTWG